VALANAKVPTLLPINVADVEGMVLTNNVKISLAKTDFEIANADVQKARGDFDYYFTLNPSYKYDQRLTNSVFDLEVVEEKTTSYSLALKKKFSLGTVTELSLQHLQIHTNSARSLLENRYQTAGQAKLTQPLLGGGGFAFNEAKLRQAELRKKQAYWTLIEKMNEVTAQSLGLFWELYKAQQEVQLKSDAVEGARSKLEEIEKRYTEGNTSSFDVIYARPRLEIAKASLLLAQSNSLEVNEKLSREILPLTHDTREIHLIPQTKSPSFFDLKIAVDVLKQKSTQEVSIAQRQRMQFEINEASVEIEKAANAKLPQFNLDLKYLTTGMDIQENQARQNMLANKNPSWTAMLTFSMPLEFNSTQGEYDRVSVAKSIKENQHRNELLSGKLEIDSSLRDLERLTTNFENNELQLERQSEILKYKKLLFQNGKISILELGGAQDEYDSFITKKFQIYADQQKLKAFIEGKLNFIVTDQTLRNQYPPGL